MIQRRAGNEGGRTDHILDIAGAVFFSGVLLRALKVAVHGLHVAAVLDAKLAGALAAQHTGLAQHNANDLAACKSKA